MGIFNNLSVIAADAAAATTETNSTMSMLLTFGPLILIFVLLYFMMIRPQRKKEKKIQKMREALEVGDSITTVGGIVGRVVNIKEDGIIIETGADRNKMMIKKWAVQTVDTLHDDAE